MTRVRTVNNYCFINEEGAMVDPDRKRPGKFFLYGNHTDTWAMLMGTEFFMSSAVLERTSEGTVITKDSAYRLGNMAPEYQEFLGATRRGIPVIGNWNIYGSKDRNYFLTGDVFPQKKALTTSKIISTDGNFLTIQRLVETPAGEVVWEDPERIFVCWDSMSKPAQNEIQQRGKVADIANFEKFKCKYCRPVLEI